jgi:hypothetical protein
LACSEGAFLPKLSLLSRPLNFSILAVFARAAACERAFQGHRIAFCAHAREGERLARSHSRKETLRLKKGEIGLHYFGAMCRSDWEQGGGESAAADFQIRPVGSKDPTLRRRHSCHSVAMGSTRIAPRHAEHSVAPASKVGADFQIRPVECDSSFFDKVKDIFS